MRMTTALSVVTAMLASGAPAHAATITENISGTISGVNTVDTEGLFGPAGGDLKGKAVIIHAQYITEDFTESEKCRISPATCTYEGSQGSVNTPGSVLIAVTINGKQVTYAPAHYGEILSSNASTNTFAAYVDTTSFGLGYRGAALSLAFTSPVAFGRPLAPGNLPAPNNSTTDYVEFFVPSDQLPAETLNFVADSASD